MRSPAKILRLHQRLVDEAGAVLSDEAAKRASIEDAMTKMRGAMQAELAATGGEAAEGRALAVAYWRSGERLLGRLAAALDDARAAEAEARARLHAAFEEKERISRYAERVTAQAKKAERRRTQNADWDRIALTASSGPLGGG